MQDMRRHGTAPDVFSFNGVMQANVGGGNWAAALEASVQLYLLTLSRSKRLVFPVFGGGVVVGGM